MVSAEERECNHQHQPVARQAPGERVVETFALITKIKDWERAGYTLVPQFMGG